MPKMTFPALSREGLEQRLHVKPLWELDIKGHGVTVAVLDTGFSHEDELDGAVIHEEDFTGEGNPRLTGYAHGSSVASAIHWVAPEASIANLKVISEHAELQRETVCRAIRHCIENFPKYKIINLSLYFEPEGCSTTSPCDLCAVTTEAVQKGIFVVAAAGNLGPDPGTITCPGLCDDALTVVATWTKREADWWDNLGWIKKWWLKDVSGEFGQSMGTSFSAAWASGGVALMKSAFAGASPREIKDAIFASAYRLPNAPEISGIFQYKEALDTLLSPRRYESAKRALYFNAGNSDAQEIGTYFTHELDLALSSIRYNFIAQRRFAEATEELSAIQGWLIPGALSDYEEQINRDFESCQAKSSESEG